MRECSICGKELEIKNKLLYCPTCKIFIGSSSGPRQTYATRGRESGRIEAMEERSEIFNIARVLKATIALLIVLGVPYGIYRLFVPVQTECIPVSSIYMMDDPDLRENIYKAMENMREISPEDYFRLCNYGTKIELRDITYYWGLYIDRTDVKTKERGLIAIDRKVAATYEHLDAVLAHEACHAYLNKEFNDSSEAPCEKRGYEYIAKKPEIDASAVELQSHDKKTDEFSQEPEGAEKPSISSRIQNFFSSLLKMVEKAQNISIKS